MSKFHVLTAVSRPENLSAIGASIATAAQRVPRHEVVWHCRFDLRRKHVGGQYLKNQMLDDISDGWVVILDDDTLMHKQFFVRVTSVLARKPDVSGLVVTQKRTTGQLLIAHPDNVAVGEIDAGQVILKRSLIADERLPTNYAGDGVWLEALLRGRSDIVYLPESVVSLHNFLSGIDVSETPERMSA
jgi:hypothetical protein